MPSPTIPRNPAIRFKTKFAKKRVNKHTYSDKKSMFKKNKKLYVII